MLVVLLSGQAPLVAHRRVGQFGRPLWVIKLRTMWTGRKSVPLRWLERLPVSTTSMYLHKKSDDARVSSGFARFCRRFSIDEIPQLLQVVKGEMTLIGPRPLTGGEIEQYYGLDALELLSVKPGLTGLWQVSGRSRLTYGQRRRLDLFFIRKRSVTLYLRVALATVPVWLTGRDAW